MYGGDPVPCAPNAACRSIWGVFLKLEGRYPHIADIGAERQWELVGVSMLYNHTVPDYAFTSGWGHS